jgi:hypothetical protein
MAVTTTRDEAGDMSVSGSRPISRPSLSRFHLKYLSGFFGGSAGPGKSELLVHVDPYYMASMSTRVSGCFVSRVLSTTRSVTH